MARAVAPVAAVALPLTRDAVKAPRALARSLPGVAVLGGAGAAPRAAQLAPLDRRERLAPVALPAKLLCARGDARAASSLADAVSAAVVRASLIRHDALAARAANARLARACHAAAAAAQPAEALAGALSWASRRRKPMASGAAKARVALAPPGDARAVARAAAGTVAEGRALAPFPREPRVAGTCAVVAQADPVARTVTRADEGHDKHAVIARVACVALANGRLRHDVAAPVATTVVGAHVV